MQIDFKNIAIVNIGGQKKYTKENTIKCAKNKNYISKEKKKLKLIIAMHSAYRKHGVKTLNQIIKTPGVDKIMKAHMFKTREKIKRKILR